MSFASGQKTDQPAQLSVVASGEQKEGNLSEATANTCSQMANDFPVAMQASQQQGIVYMLSKAGYLLYSFQGVVCTVRG